MPLSLPHVFCTLALSAVCPALSADAVDKAANALVGTWKLIQYTDTPEGSAPIHAFGNPPTGQFIFTADGHVSITIMRNPPNPGEATTDPDPDACVPGWYCAYFGTYTVDYEHGIWVTHVQGTNIPSYLGTDQPRSFRIEGDTLTISEGYMAEGRRVTAVRVLRREIATR